MQLTTAVVPKVSVWNDTLPQNVNNARSVSAILIFHTGGTSARTQPPTPRLMDGQALDPNSQRAGGGLRLTIYTCAMIDSVGVANCP